LKLTAVKFGRIKDGDAEKDSVRLRYADKGSVNNRKIQMLRKIEMTRWK
jgi:hypothetical protein